MDLSKLKAYHGYQSSIIPLSSDYYFYLASWDRTPTEFSHFSNIWLITPDDKRILFSDPYASSEIVCIYHRFHEILGSSISLDWASENQLHIKCTSLDETNKLNIEIHLQESLLSRLLVSIASSPPTSLRVSKPIVAVSNLLVNLLVTKGGSTLVGKTETGQPFYLGEIERLYQVGGISVSLNGEDLGKVSSPTWPLEFGDGVPFGEPVIKLGTLWIPFEQDMVEVLV
jgi:hypothetical protein